MVSQELLEELEALKWTYGEDVQVQEECGGQEGMATTIHAKLYPNTGEREEQRFVEVELVLTGFDSNYPATAPTLALKDGKGLGDEREKQLQAVLHQERESLLGTMMVGAIIEAGRDFLTSINHPRAHGSFLLSLEGHCAFCLEGMTSGSSQQEGGLVKLPFCYHAFHKDCFVGWWAWRQHALMQKEKELVAHTGISAPEFILKDQLPEKEEHKGWQATVFCTLCPCCRAGAPLTHLRHLDKDLRSALRALLYPSKCPDASARPDCAEAGEGQVDFEAVSDMQAQHRRIYERQLAVGGIISQEAGAPTIVPAESAEGAAAADGTRASGRDMHRNGQVVQRMGRGGQTHRQQHERRLQISHQQPAVMQQAQTDGAVPPRRGHGGGPQHTQQQQQQQGQHCRPSDERRGGMRGGRGGGDGRRGKR